MEKHGDKYNMLRMQESYYKPIEDDINIFFYDTYWKEIFDVLDSPYFRLNAINPLITAIRNGTIKYSNGIFTGIFNMKISAELEKFAKYDGRIRVWKGVPPSAVSATAAVANDKAKKLNETISRLIDGIPQKIESAIESLKYSIDAPLFSMNAQADRDLSTLGISVDVTPELSKNIADDYTNNLNLNIVNWQPEETARLRDMIEKNVLSGYNRNELISMIQSEYEVSKNKAKFWARNETSLLTAKIRDTRYQDAGIKKYKWSSSQDVRVRDWHKELNGKVFLYSSPPVIDRKTGQRGNPGETYNCRCTAIPLLA